MGDEGVGKSSEGNGQPPGPAAGGRLRPVFISYASLDAPIAHKVCSALEAAGFPCWIAPRNVVPGTMYADGIVHAIDDSTILVLILSEQAVASAHVGREIERAVSKRHPVVALRIDGAPLTPAFEYFLNQSQWIEGGGGDAAIAQLVGAVGQHLAPESVPSNRSQQATPKLNKAATPPRRWIFAGVLLAIILAAGYFFVDKVSRNSRFATPVASEPRTAAAAPVSTPAPRAPRTAIAVMPFANLTGDAAKDYLGDGMAEELINILTKVPGLKVPARTSSFAYKGRNTDIRQIAKDLGVGTILEGSVRAAGKRIRITAELINAQDGLHLWSETYDDKFTDVFNLQDKLATQIARALQPNLAVTSMAIGQAPPTQDVEAYRLYLQASSLLDRNIRPNNSRAVELLQQAVTRDSKFARAYALLAYAHFWAFVVFEGPSAHLLQAEQEARKALALQSNEPLAHVTLAMIGADRAHWLEMEAHDQAALLEADAIILKERAIHLLLVGHLRESQQQIEKAYALAPASAEVAGISRMIYGASGQQSEAVKFSNLARDLGGPFDPGGLILSGAARQAGRYAEAANLIISAASNDSNEIRMTEVVKLVYAAMADPTKRDVALAARPRLYPDRGDPTPNNSATAMRACSIGVESYAILGALDVAYSLIDQCLNTQQQLATASAGLVGQILWQPEMGAFRQDPHFQSLVTRLGLMDYWQHYGPPDDCDIKDGKLTCH
jgi:TolB-like protein